MRQLLCATSFDTVDLEIAINYSVYSQSVNASFTWDLTIQSCVFGLSSWLNTRSSTFSVFSLTHTERGLPLPGCRSIVPALRIIFNRVKIPAASVKILYKAQKIHRFDIDTHTQCGVIATNSGLRSLDQGQNRLFFLRPRLRTTVEGKGLTDSASRHCCRCGRMAT